MADQPNGTSKKFLYNDLKKSKENEEERQFHSRGYHPMVEPSIIDLEKVWSVKDMILNNNGFKPMASDAGANANTSYYSRHGQYKSNIGKAANNQQTSLPSTWSPRTDVNKADNGSSSPFDF